MRPPRVNDQQLPLMLVQEIRTRKGNVIYFGDDYRRLLKQRTRVGSKRDQTAPPAAGPLPQRAEPEAGTAPQGLR